MALATLTPLALTRQIETAEGGIPVDLGLGTAGAHLSR